MASLGRVCLFPAGMSAIFACHDCGLLLRWHHFSAIQSRRPNEIGATVSTPPSHSATNHSKRCVSGRGVGTPGISDIFLNSATRWP